MKSVKFLLAILALAVGVSVSAQEIDFSDEKYSEWGDTPEERKKQYEMFSDAKFSKWGETPEERKANYQIGTYLGEALTAKDYDLASRYFNHLYQNCPDASVNIYIRGVSLYKGRINNAKRERNLEAQRIYIDSLIFVYDQRVVHFGNAQKGRADILDSKARDMIKLLSSDKDRIRLRNILKDAVDAAIEKGKVELDIATRYFSMVCDDYSNDIDDTITSEVVLAEYERLAPYYDNLTEEKDKQQKDVFDSKFGTSGAASCENLEALFSVKLAADPDNDALLAQAVQLMSRAQCSSDFFFATTEKYYAVSPSSETALFLAQGFQNRGENDKALKYLREALAVETDPAKKEPLYAKIGLIEVTNQNYAAAAEAARELRGINPQNGYSYFILGQCYASNRCTDDKIGGVSVYWAAYDAMAQAVTLLKDEPEVQKAAQQLMAAYRGAFPAQETCFFAELKENERYTITCGFAAGQTTTIRYK
ncbi:MAG: enzyme of heme biosynthesis [Alistipes sp.]|jgi:tetratricopeptide (TPR) repeat protein|nr:enzyme of heme biosynthesis [Alistipes sp.]